MPMRPNRALSLSANTALVYGLTFFVTTAAAHGGEDSTHHDANPGAGSAVIEYPPTYFAHPEHTGLMYAHIALMIMSWVLLLPVAVMLSLTSSRFTLPVQFAFLGTNALAILLVTIYNAQTPDLYPGNAHHTIGWIVTCVVSAHVAVNLAGSIARAVNNYRRGNSNVEEEHAFMPVAMDAGHQFQSQRLVGGHRLSDDDSGQSFEHSTESLRSDSGSTHIGEDEDFAHHHKEYDENDEEQSLQQMPSTTPKAIGAWTVVLSKVVSGRLWRYVDIGYKIVDRIILPFGFVTFATGIVAYGRFFEGMMIFGGLAHWIKGGVFFWLGLFNLGRWCGAFADLGWAWNIRPKRSHHRWHPSAEFVESALIFFYGSTNIFLEHLGRWNGKWSSQDLEHVSITVLFIGGGMCGMLIESSWIRDLLNTTVADIKPTEAYSEVEREQLKTPATYGLSLNPIPALVILLLGIMMSSHHQQSMISTMVHKQWGNLLMGASLARGLTYVLVFIRPPQSVLPSRPPTELLAAFGLIAGGIVFMASSSDTVDGMIHYDLDAMFMYTMTMGLVGLLMAWEVVVLAIKGWALRRERRSLVPSFV